VWRNSLDERLNRRLTGIVLLALTAAAVFAPLAEASDGDSGGYLELAQLLEKLRRLNPFAPNPQLVRAARVLGGLANCSGGLVAEAAGELSRLAMEAAEGGLAAGWWRASQDLFRAVASMPWELEYCPSSLVYEALRYALGSVGSYTYTPPHGSTFASDAGQLAWWVVSNLGGDGFASVASTVASADPNSALALAALLGRADEQFWMRVLSDVSTRRGLCLVFALAKPDSIPEDVAASALSILAGGWAQDPGDTVAYAAQLMERGDHLCAYAILNLLDSIMLSKGYLQLLKGLIPAPPPALRLNVTSIGSFNTPRLIALSQGKRALELVPLTLLDGRVEVSPSILAALLASTLGPALLPHYNTTACQLYLKAAEKLLAEAGRGPVGFHAWNKLADLALLCYISSGDESTVTRLLLLQPYLPLHPGILSVIQRLNPETRLGGLPQGYWILSGMGLVDGERVSLEHVTFIIGIDPFETGTLRKLGFEAILVASGLLDVNHTMLLSSIALHNRSLALKVASMAAAWYAMETVRDGVYMLVDRDARAVVEALLRAQLEGGVSLDRLYSSIFNATMARGVGLEGLIPVAVDALEVEVKALREGLSRLANLSGTRGGYAGRLLELVGRLGLLLGSGDYSGAVNVSGSLRDLILSNPRSFAQLLVEANYTAGDAGVTLLAARAASIAYIADGRAFLSPETVDEVLARVEDSIARLYLHPRHPGGAAGATGEGEGSWAAGAAASVSRLLEELREALSRGDVVRAAKLLAAIYAAGNSTAVAEAVRIVESYTSLNPSLLRRLTESLASERVNVGWRGFHEPHLHPTGAMHPALAGPQGVGVRLAPFSAAAGLLAVLGLAVLAVWAARARGRRRVRRAAGAAGFEGLRGEVVALFAEALSALERVVGRARGASETVREYARELPENLRAAYLEAVAAYEEAKFSMHRIGWEHVERVRRLLRMLGWRRGVP
jgi:hypothetical protein